MADRFTVEPIDLADGLVRITSHARKTIRATIDVRRTGLVWRDKGKGKKSVVEWREILKRIPRHLVSVNLAGRKVNGVQSLAEKMKTATRIEVEFVHSGTARDSAANLMIRAIYRKGLMGTLKVSGGQIEWCLPKFKKAPTFTWLEFGDVIKGK